MAINFKDKSNTNIFFDDLTANYYINQTKKKVDDSIIKVSDLINKRDELKLNQPNNEKIKGIDNKIEKLSQLKAHEIMKAGINLQESASKVINTKDTKTYISNKNKYIRKSDDTGLKNAITALNNKGFFSLKSNKAITTVEDFMIDFTDYNGVNMTATTSDIERIHARVENMINNKHGFIHSIDTETLGATTSTNVWRPTFVTEFAKVTTDLANPNNIQKTNVLLADPDTYEKEYKRIMEALESGAAGQRRIKNDPSLKVSMERFALYGHKKTNIKFNEATGYSYVDSIADISDIGNIYNKDLITAGYKKLKSAKTTTKNIKLKDKTITIGSDVKEYIDSLASIQKTIQKGTGIINGYNINNFDFKTINSSLQTIITKEGNENIKEYALYKFNVDAVSEVGLRNLQGSVLDMQNFTRAYTNKYGNKSLIGDDIFKQIHGQRVNRQEYIGQKFYSDLMKKTSHAAIADTGVVHAFVLKPGEGLEGKTLFQYLYEGIMNTDYKSDKITKNNILIANKGTAFNSDRNVLDYVTDIKGNTYFSSGYSIVNGVLRHDNINIAPSNGIRKNAMYQIDGMFTAKTKDFYDGLGIDLPDYSSDKLHIVKLKQYHDKEYGNGLINEGFIYKVFNSEDEAKGFISSSFSNVGSFDKEGNFILNKNIEDKITTAWKNKTGNYTIDTKTWKSLSDIEKVQKYASYIDKKVIDNKATNFLFGDTSAKKIAGALDFIQEMKKAGYEDLIENPESLVRFYNYGGAKTGIRKNGTKLVKKDFDIIEGIMKNNLGFFSLTDKEQKLLPSTANNALYALDNIIKLEDYYKKVLDSITDNKSKNGARKEKERYIDAYRRLAKEGIKVDDIFNEVNTKVLGDTVLKASNGNVEKAMQAVSHVSKDSETVSVLKNIYDFKLSNNFYLNKHNNKTKRFSVFNQIEDYLTIDASKTNPTTAAINAITNKFLGSTQINNEDIMFRYQRAAFQNFVKEINANKNDHKQLFKNKDFKSMIDDVLNNNEFDLETSAQILVDSITNVKKNGKNLKVGINKPRYNMTTHISNKNAKALNEINKDTINEALKTVNIVSFNDNNKAQLVNDIVASRMFSKDKLLNNSFSTEKDQARALRLYEDYERRMTNTVKDLIDAVDMIPGASLTFNKATGDVIMSHNSESKVITELANLRLDNNKLWIRGYAGTNIEFHEALYFDRKTGKIKLGTNLGSEFGEYNRIQKNVKIAMDNNNPNLLDVVNQRMIRDASAYKDSALLNFSVKDYITGNAKIDVSQADDVFSYMFGKDATEQGKAIWDELVNSGKLNSKNIEQYADSLTKLSGGELSPILRTMSVTDMTTIMSAFIDKNDPNAPALEDILKTIAITGKDTDAARGIYSTGSRNIGNTMNMFDNQARPTIISQLNARYMRTQLNKKVQGYDNLLLSSSIIEDTDIMNNLYRELDIGLNNTIGVQTDFTHGAAVLGTMGLESTFANEMERVTKDFKLSSDLTINDRQKAVENMYTKAYNNLVGSTFEQSRLMDSRMVETIYGHIPQDVQKLSSLKDLEGALDIMKSDIDSDKAKNKVKDAMDIIGKIEIDAKGNVKYTKSAGTIVHKREGLFKTHSPYGDQIGTFASKFDTGVLNFNIRTKEGVELTEKEVSELLSKKIKKQLQDKSDEEAAKLIKEYKRPEGLFRLLLEDYGTDLKSTFEIQNVNSSELLKMGNSDKGMSYITLTKIGSLDETLKSFMKDIGEERYVGNNAISPQALAAYINDISRKEPDKLKELLEKYEVDNVEQLTNKMVHLREVEQHELSRMLFSDKGIFKGEVSAVINDNYIGHKNFGTTNSSTLSRATELYSKYYGVGKTKEDKYKSAMDQIIDMVNNNEEFQFLQMHIGDKGQIPHLLTREGTTYLLDETMKAEVDQYSSLNQEAFNKLIEHIDTKLQKADADKNDRLVYTDVYTYNKKGELEKQKKVIGNLRTYTKNVNGEDIQIVAGVNQNVNTKLYNDSEVQSYISKEFLDAKEELYKKKSELRDAQENNEADLITTLKHQINNLQERIFNEEPYSERVKIDDQYRNILSAYKLDSTLEDNYNKRIKDNRVSKTFIDAAREFMIQDKDGKWKLKDNIQSDNVYNSLLESIKGLMTYDPTKEEKLTEDMLKDERYSKYANIYDFITNDMHMQLGVESAEKIYGLQGAYKSYSFNKTKATTLENDLIDNYGFKAINIKEFANNFGVTNSQLDNLTEQGYIVNLGEDFNNLKVAIPGLGSHAGDQEIRKDWQSKFNSLAKTWNEYNSYIGDTSDTDSEYISNIKGRIINQVGDIQEATNKIVSKQGELGRMAKIESNLPYTRTKLLSSNDAATVRSLANPDAVVPLSEEAEQAILNNSFKSKATINGRTIAEWEKGGLKSGVFFDYGAASVGEFERMGFFNDSFIKSMGMNSRAEMENYLEQYGTMELVDRYPNIRQKSVQNVRMFLNKSIPDNAVSLAEHTMIKMNGDSDGDSVSKMLVQYHGVNFSQYDINKRRAQDYYAKHNIEATDEEVRQRTINYLMSTENNNKKLSKQQATEVFDQFKQYEASTTMEALYNIDSVAEDVLPTMFKDETKNFKISGGVVNGKRIDNTVGVFVEGMNNVSAQVEGGKSILGKIRVTNLQKAPGHLDEKGGVNFLIDNTNKINSMMKEIIANKDELIKNTEVDMKDYKHVAALINKAANGESPNIHSFKYGSEQHEALDEILSLYEKDKASSKPVLSTSLSEAQDTIINRIRADIYNQNATSKSNKGVIGEVNTALYSIRQASSDTLGKRVGDNKAAAINDLIQEVGYELEEHVISSKKKVFEPGDTRLKNLSQFISEAKLPKGNSLASVKSDISTWMYEYMDESKINELYQHTIVNNVGSIVGHESNIAEKAKTYFEASKGVMSIEQATAKAQADLISDVFVTGINNLNNDSESRAAIKMYGAFGRRSGSIERIANVNLQDLSNESFSATANRIVSGQKIIDKTEIPKPTSVNPKTAGSPRIKHRSTANIDGEVINAVTDAFKGVSSSGLAMGVLGLAAGLMISGYASGNPLKDPKNDNIENKPEEVQNEPLPQFFNDNGGYAQINPQQRGYVINIKADTKRGQRYTKKAMKQAVEASVGGAVNINMNFKSNNSGGFTDKDIEDIMQNYL
jgi:hypothetical protein